MKITMNEDEARRVLDLIITDHRLEDVAVRVQLGLNQAARNPMLTAAELEAVLDVVRGWVVNCPQVKLPPAGERIRRQVLAAIPKLDQLALKQRRREAFDQEDQVGG